MTSIETTRVAAFTGGRHDPSARLRIRQYADDLRKCNIKIDEYFPSTGSAHPTSGGISRVPWLLSQVRQRYGQTKNISKHDITIFQRQLITTINSFEFKIAAPRLLDIDDAIWLTARFHSADRLSRSCDAVICGNNFIAEHFSTFNSNIHVIPTAVDVRRWKPPTVQTLSIDSQLLIGWIGSQGNHQYLYGIESALQSVLKECKNASILVVSDAAPKFSLLPPSRVTFRQWSEATEVEAVQSMAIGIMPLPDTPWARGKCSCKLLQYMACEIPAVAAPIGTNLQVTEAGGALLARSDAEWVDAIISLLKNEKLRADIGTKGRTEVIQHYATEVVAIKLAKIIRQFC
jgi:glycosyltransferase involved in cell wall biosynthesis